MTFLKAKLFFFGFLFLLLMVLLLLRGYHELKPTRGGAIFGKNACMTSHKYHVHHQLATTILSSKMAAVSLLSSVALVALMVTGVRRHMRASLKKTCSARSGILAHLLVVFFYSLSFAQSCLSAK